MAKKLTPHYCAATIYDIPYKELKAQGLHVLFCDLDNTVAAYDAPLPDENFLNWVELRKEEGWTVYILSNNDENRVLGFCNAANLTGFSKLYKPLRFKTKQILDELKLAPADVVFIGDQVFTDVWMSNQLGFYSILVDPVSSGDLLKTKINRALEKLFRNRFIYGKNKNW